VKIVLPWLSEIVRVPDDPEAVAREISLRGFEVASVEGGALPVIDFEVTANRPDCLSHVGLAREASVIWGALLEAPAVAAIAPGPSEALDVRLEDAGLCPRYCAQVFEVRPGASPDWLAARLDAAGVRPINNIVDVTNYVMLEIGQPMHAFDLERVAGRTLVIRRARPNETLTTLDGVNRTLDPEMLVIADAERASAIGGVMGGRDSEIGSTTRLIALESACFHPPSVRRTSKRLGLKTEAAVRFERGSDIAAPPFGIARAAALFAQIGAGRPLGGLIDRYPTPRTSIELPLRASRIRRVLGQDVPAADVERFLTLLGFAVRQTDDGEGSGWLVTVPSFRVDVAREVDLIEEVGRHYGFDRLPVTFPSLSEPQAPPAPAIARDRLIRQVLTAAGFSESMTFAFIERQAAIPFHDGGTEPAAIANPLSEKFAALRPSILPGLLDSCVHNRRRERRDVRLFETGSRFTSAGEGRAAAFAWCGAATGPHWSGPARAVDFFDVKGVVELVARTLDVDVEFVPAERSWLTAGRGAEVVATIDGRRTVIGVVGQIAPGVAEARGFPASEELFAAELDVTALGDATRAALAVEPLPRYPSIVRDISILVDEALPAATVRGTIRAAAPPTLTSIVEFDRYQGTGVPEGRISLSVRLTFRAPERTMTDEEAEAATAAIVEALRSAHGAERR
jgi:phenylalanyl-tRNA synthetase beta chain